MTVLFVRHADARPRHGWDRPDLERPLTAQGRRQALGLVELFAQRKLTRLVTSPYLRCIETLTPLASAFEVDIEISPALAEGASDAGIALVRSLAGLKAGDHVVLCSHGDVIPDVLGALSSAERVEIPSDARCSKGSTWVLEAKRSRFTTASYLKPMA